MPTLTAVSKMTGEHWEVGEALTAIVRDVLDKISHGPNSLTLPIAVRLWRAPGCHEFLASLGNIIVCHLVALTCICKFGWSTSTRAKGSK